MMTKTQPLILVALNYDYLAIEEYYYEVRDFAKGDEIDKNGMIYALREYTSSGEIANKTDVLNYDDIAKIRSNAISYYEENGDVPYSMGELENVLSKVGKDFKTKSSKNNLKYTSKQKYH